MVRIIHIIFIAAVFFWGMMIGCEKSPTVPQETFSVVASISVITLDTNSIALSVPVNFKIFRDASSELMSNDFEENFVLKSDEEGYVEYRHEFFFQEDDLSSIIVDVSDSEFESIQYWTAYFSIDDTPAKQVELVLEVIPR